MIVKTSGVILKEVKTQDSDKMLTVLTSDMGKIRVSAKHIRNSKKNSGVSFLSFSEFTLSEGKDIYFLRQASVIESFYELSENIEALSLAAYLAQLASEVTPEGDESAETLSLLLNTYYVMAKNKYDLKTAKLVFEIKLMELHGMMPDFTACSDCGKTDEILFFDVYSGNVNCSDCASEGVMLNLTCQNLISYIMNSDVKRVFSFKTSNETIDFLAPIIEKFCINQIGRTLKTLDYYKSL